VDENTTLNYCLRRIDRYGDETTVRNIKEMYPHAVIRKVPVTGLKPAPPINYVAQARYHTEYEDEEDPHHSDEEY